MDVIRIVKKRLAKLPPAARKAFALARAESLLRSHESLPVSEQSPFALSWRPVLDAMWLSLAGFASDAPERALAALQAFRAGPYFPRADLEGPFDADEDAAAACIFAAECFTTGEVGPAVNAAARCIDATLRTAAERLQLNYEYTEEMAKRNKPTAWTQEHMERSVQREMARQLAELDLLQTEGVTRNLLEHLRG